MKEARILKKPFFWLGMSFLLVLAAIFQWPRDELHLIFCDVGQGDAILITHGSTQILVDGGPDHQVLDCLGENLPFWDQTIEMVLATHPDADHITGLVEVIKRYQVKQFVLNSVGKESAVFEAFQKAVLAEGAPVYFPQTGDQINSGSLKMKFLWPQKQTSVLGATTLAKEANETSLVVQLSYQDFEALLTGDISSQIETRLDLEDVEVLKVPHHGSKYSTSPELLDQTSPEVIIISVGKNSFGHPTDEVLTRIKEKQIPYLRTDQEGTIEIITDGQKWEIEN